MRPSTSIAKGYVASARACLCSRRTSERNVVGRADPPGGTVQFHLPHPAHDVVAAVRAGQVEAEPGGVVGQTHHDALGPVPRAGELFGPPDAGNVVPAALHGPDGVPVGGERLRRVGGPPEVNDHRDSVQRAKAGGRGAQTSHKAAARGT